MQYQKSKAELRHEKILQMLDASDSVSIALFCETLGCSESTLRNDLAFLEKGGKLRRLFGGAIRNESEQYQQNFKLSDRLRAYLREKEAIAKYIVNHILLPGSVVCLDASTTNEVLAREIVASELSLSLLTNSLSIANIIDQSSNISLYLFGGYYNKEIGYFSDSLNSSLSHVRADLYFMGVSGVRQDGFTSIGRDETASKMALMKIASQTIVPADHSKFHQSGLSMLDDFSRVRTVITDAGATEKEYEPLRDAGVKVHLAKLE